MVSKELNTGHSTSELVNGWMMVTQFNNFIITSHYTNPSMFTKSFFIFWTGFALMIIATAMFYLGSRSYMAYSLFGAGFVLIGISILLGFFKMISDK